MIARHLAHPRGFFGRFVGLLMNRHNARINSFALESLGVQFSDRVIEIGFGGGVTLARLLEAADHLTGVDISVEMVKQAQAKFRTEVETGRADFLIGSIEAMPLKSDHFDKACSVNTVYFWRSLSEGAMEIRRVLKKDGVLALGFLPGEAMERLGFPKDVFTFRSVEDVKDALEQAGFAAIEVRRPALDAAWVVILAR